MKPKVKIVIVLFFATVVTLLFFWPDVFFCLALAVPLIAYGCVPLPASASNPSSSA
jgi:hypothetical protein